MNNHSFGSIEEEKKFRIKKSKLANKITISRLIAGFALIPATIWGGFLTGVLFSIVFLPTDVIDGRIAKKNNAKTAIGSILDQVSDKLYAIMALGLLIYATSPAGVLLLGELAILGTSAYNMKKGRKALSSTTGRFKSWPLGITFGLSFLALSIPEIIQYSEYYRWAFNFPWEKLEQIIEKLIKCLIPFTIGAQGATIYSYVSGKKNEDSKNIDIVKSKKEYLKLKTYLIEIKKHMSTLCDPDFYSIYEENQDFKLLIEKTLEYETNNILKKTL